MNNYRKALINSKSIEALQYIDEMNALNHTTVMKGRQDHYDSILSNIREKSKEDQIRWFEMHEKAKKDAQATKYDLFNQEKLWMDQHILRVKEEEKLKNQTMREIKMQYKSFID
jgi:hypothetical protein